MKLKSLFLFLALVMGSVMIANAQQKDRMVFWVHGLGGDGSSWQKAAEATQVGNAPTGFLTTKIVSAQLSYSEFNNAISTASDKLNQDVVTTWNGLKPQYSGITDKTKNFIIAHSQGGIVSRYMDKRYQDFPQVFGDRNFGGIVTFGTPHQGAIALNNTPMLLQLIKEGCTDVLAGPFTEGVLKTFPLSLIAKGEDVKAILEPACNFVQEKIVPILASDFISPINQDYKVGAAVITEINSVQTQTKKVAFYGIEDDPILWRMLYSLREKQPNLFDAFQADPDSRLIGEVNSNLLKYVLKVNESQSNYDNLGSQFCPWWWYLSRVGTAYCSIHDPRVQKARENQRDIRDAWTKGVNWWLDANNRFKAAVGAAGVAGTSTTLYECECISYDMNGNYVGTQQNTTATPQDCYNQGQSWLTNCAVVGTTVAAFTLVDVPSDGLVQASSASGYPGAATKEMIGSNHQQMRNDSNTKDRLNELYNGIHGIYFKSRQ